MQNHRAGYWRACGARVSEASSERGETARQKSQENNRRGGGGVRVLQLGEEVAIQAENHVFVSAVELHDTVAEGQALAIGREHDPAAESVAADGDALAGAAVPSRLENTQPVHQFNRSIVLAH